MKRQIRMYIAQLFIGWAFSILPKNCPKTIRWFAEQPFED